MLTYAMRACPGVSRANKWQKRVEGASLVGISGEKLRIIEHKVQRLLQLARPVNHCFEVPAYALREKRRMRIQMKEGLLEHITCAVAGKS